MHKPGREDLVQTVRGQLAQLRDRQEACRAIAAYTYVDDPKLAQEMRLLSRAFSDAARQLDEVARRTLFRESARA